MNVFLSSNAVCEFSIMLVKTIKRGNLQKKKKKFFFFCSGALSI